MEAIKFVPYSEVIKLSSSDILYKAIYYFSSNFKISSNIIYKKYFAIDCLPIDFHFKKNHGTFFIATSNSGIRSNILNDEKMMSINLYNYLYKVNFNYDGVSVERLR